MNYKHLRYFWMIARAGGVSRAAERLHLTPQTLSGQLGQFEQALGVRLFRRVGRRLELTEIGQAVYGYADEIFRLGTELEDVVRRGSPGTRPVFRVGASDILPKWIVFRLLEPALAPPDPARMSCREGKLDDLLADLAVHRLDVVLSDSPLPPHVEVRGYNHLLGRSGFTFFASSALARARRGTFPELLDDAPLLLPGPGTVLHTRFAHWLQRRQLHPRIVGEFDDSALLNAFGQAGVGFFAAPTAIENEVARQYDVVAVGRTDEVVQEFYVISVERRITHPAVVAIGTAAHGALFRAPGAPAGGARRS